MIPPYEPSPDTDWITKYASTVLAAIIGAISGVIAVIRFIYRLDGRLKTVEDWTSTHDRAVETIVNRMDTNVGRINDRIDRLSELLIQVSRKIGD